MATKIKVKVSHSRPGPSKLEHHKPKPSATLMRQSVQRPNPTLKRQIRAIGAAEYGLTFKSATVTPNRQILAQKKVYKPVPKSPLVNHFADVHKSVGKPVSTSQPISDPSLVLSKPRPDITAQPKRTVNDELLLEKALEMSQPKPKSKKAKSKRHSNLNKIWLMALIVFAVIAFFANQKIDSISNKATPVKTTIAIDLPRDIPAGYTLYKSQDSSGAINAVFKSLNSNKSFSLSEKSSLWASSDLKANFVDSVAPNATAQNINGTTVYLYGDADATWIKNSIWYTLDSNGNLSQAQLTSIANGS